MLQIIKIYFSKRNLHNIALLRNSALLRNNAVIRINMKCCAISDGKLGCSSGGKSTSITLGYSVHCNAISLAGGQLQFRSSTPSYTYIALKKSKRFGFTMPCVTVITSSELNSYRFSGRRCAAGSHQFVVSVESETFLATPIPHDFNPNRIIILTIALFLPCSVMCLYGSHFWFQTWSVIIIEAFSNSCRFGQHGISSLHQCALNVASEK
ncbi:DNA-repair protein [Trichinella spiralis]|uniref:DNA-repair protein n=1 Tax=Trichinella spiralis TaxID=6334 RepID=UPI0001EFC9A1|nr:DNA-repair protein [Trichinella spiralis]